MIAVFGLGFVGLATALAFAEKGFNVCGYDVDSQRVDTLRSSKLPFYEPGLEQALQDHLNTNFTLARNITEALGNAEIIFICVGTPAHEDGSADLSYLLSTIESIIKSTDKNEFRVLVIKSTVPPGTTREEVAPFLEGKGWQIGLNIGLANNPEFLREGKAWSDVISPDRIVVGVNDQRTSDVLKKLHENFDTPFHSVSWNTGEYIKYLSNTMLATMISYANDASMIASVIGDIDISRSFEILHQDRRWAGNPANMATYVYPGCGFGGYCLPKDTSALYEQAKAKGYESPILSATMTVNIEIAKFVAKNIMEKATPDKRIGILGLSFKPDTDDVRQSPAKTIIDLLIASGMSVLAYDPFATLEFQTAYGKEYEKSGRVSYASDLSEVIDEAHPLVILTGWREFIEKRDAMAGCTVLDYRYIL